MDAAIGTPIVPQATRRPAGDIVTRVEPTANVQPAPAIPAAATDIDRRMASKLAVSPDGATGEIVFRVIDTATGSVTVQTPSESRLKLRAYIDGVSARKSADPSFETTA